jgi:murein DD-endopeptidase MepM/ murein hydrolase activator NlpD
MDHKLSLIILGDSGSKIKQIHLSRKQYVGWACVLGVLLLGLTYAVVDYIGLQWRFIDKSIVERRLAGQSEEVAHQRQQIQKFAQEINALKERIVALDEFEERIRVLANIDPPGNKNPLFGIGGSAPEDLDAASELDQSHKKMIKEMHQQINQLEDASQGQQKTFSHLIKKLEEQKNLLAHTPAIRPAQGWVTSAFAYRQSPFTGKREFHKGIDIANQHGTPIIATADGTVAFMGEDGAFGIVVVIDHGYGINTRYAHLQKGLKSRGDLVQRGEAIGFMGNTGRSTGPHLHYEVRLNGVPINPDKYILN